MANRARAMDRPFAFALTSAQSGSALALREDMRATDELVAFQANLLARHAPHAGADAFCAGRIETRGAHQYGALPPDTDFETIISRARPR